MIQSLILFEIQSICIWPILRESPRITLENAGKILNKCQELETFMQNPKAYQKCSEKKKTKDLKKFNSPLKSLEESPIWNSSAIPTNSP